MNAIRIAAILFSTAAFAYAAAGIKTTRKNLTPKTAMEELERTGNNDTIRYTDQITLYGYEKSLTDANETFYVSNKTPFCISRLLLKFSYLTLAGEMLHEETYDIPCDIPPGETRRISVRSFDRQHSLYYYQSRKPKRSATPYRIRFSILQYDVRITPAR